MPTARSDRGRSLRLLASIAVLGALAAARVHGDPVVYHVDSVRGSDDAGRDGSASAPLGTIGYAVERAAAAGAAGLELRLAPGDFAVSAGTPLVIPPAFERFAIAGAPAFSTIRGASCGAIFSWAPAPESGRAELAWSRLVVEGGSAALELVADGGQRVDLVAEHVVFRAQATVSVLVSVAAAGVADIEIGASEFHDAGGLFVEALSGGEVDLRVAESRFAGLPASPLASTAGTPSVGALALHAANGSRLWARIEGNFFRDVLAALIVSADETVAEQGADLSVHARNNVIDGSAPVRPYGVRDAFLLSLWPHHEADMLIAQNTIVGVEGAVVAQDNLGTAGGGEAIPWTFANNVCSAIAGPSEFAGEFDPRSGSFDEDFPPPSIAVRNNVLARSPTAARGADGNVLAVDAGFLAPAEHDFRLRANSPAVDAGDTEFAEGLVTDVAGHCRVAAATCQGSRYRVDAGAYESGDRCRGEAAFVRGDCGMDGRIHLSDPILLFNFLFLGADRPICLDACDADDDGSGSLTDGILVLTFLFLGGSEPSPPGVRPGYDPTCDELPCSAAE